MINQHHNSEINTIKESSSMNVSCVFANSVEQHNIIKAISEAYKDAKVKVFAYDNAEVADYSNVVYCSSIAECIEGAEIIINSINVKQSFNNEYNSISEKYGIDIFKARATLDIVLCFSIIDKLDELAQAVLSCKSSPLIINACEPVDIVTSYLYKAHNIESYGLSRKGANNLDSLLKAVNVEVRGKLDYKQAGINNMLWIYQIKDKDGNDLYPEIRGKISEESLNVKRQSLTCDSIKSLRFYGYYHSYNTEYSSFEDSIIEFLKAYNSAKKRTIWLNAVNKDSIYNIDNKAVVEVPFAVKKDELAREKVELPLQCILAMTDNASAVSLVAQTLKTKSETIYRRTIKLDPYLASILTLDELDSLASDILTIEQGCKAVLQ